MTDIEVKLNAWEINYVSVLAVQGESEGRTIIATLIDRTGQTDGTFNAASVDRPIDLTGVSARLYCSKSDGTVTFSNGTVTDATNGVASFVLPYQATTAAGEVSCQILLTKTDNSTVKAIGLTLNVQMSNLDGAVESSSEFSALVTALNGVQSAFDDAGQAVTNAQTAINSANEAIGNINSAITNMQEETQSAIADTNTARDNANNAANKAKNMPYLGEDHYWYVYNPTTDQYEKTATQAGTQYATFGVNPSTGNLEMYTADTYSGANFNLNDSGELEVVI